MSQIHIKINPELHKLLVESAKVHRRSLNSEVTLILEEAIAHIPVIGKIESGRVAWTDKARAEFEEYKNGRILDPRD